MQQDTQSSLRASLDRLLKRHSILIGVILFVSGLILRWIATGVAGGTAQDVIWQVLGDFGVFVAAGVAIPFIYERFLKTEDRAVFIHDMERVIDSSLNKLTNQGKFVRIYEQGRNSEINKIAFYRGAKVEIIELGLRLETISQDFENKSAKEFKEPVKDLLRNGVIFRCATIDPDSEITKLYEKDRGEVDLSNRIRQSVSTLCGLSREFQSEQLKGSFEVYTWDHFPYCYITMVDPTEAHGRVLVSHYLQGIRRSDVPIMEFSKSSNPELFATYHSMVKNVLSTANKLDVQITLMNQR